MFVGCEEMDVTIPTNKAKKSRSFFIEIVLNVFAKFRYKLIP